MPSARPSDLAITAFITWPMSLGAEAPVSAIAAATIASSSSSCELRRQVPCDQLGLGLLLLGELGAAAVAELRGGLQPALALAAQHRELVVAALLGGLLQLGQHQPQRADALLLAGLHRAGDVGCEPAR